MGILSDIRVIDTRYNGVFTFTDIINDPLIRQNTEKMYVPNAEIRDNIFIKKDETVAVANSSPIKVRFLYLSGSGKLNTNPDASYLQIPNSCKGFLVRLSLDGNISENLQLDYIVDLANIKYSIDSVMSSLNNSVVVDEIIHFESLDYNDYPRVNFDPRIKDFFLHKKELFELYF